MAGLPAAPLGVLEVELPSLLGAAPTATFVSEIALSTPPFPAAAPLALREEARPEILPRGGAAPLAALLNPPPPNPLLGLLEPGKPLARLPTPDGLLDSLPWDSTRPVRASCSSVALASPSPPPAPPPPPAFTERTRAISPACLPASPTPSLVAVRSLAADTAA